MQILTIGGYKFLSLRALSALREQLLFYCQSQDLKGTVLLSEEGININVAGEKNNITTFQKQLKQDERFSDMTFRESYSSSIPFKRLKIKIKPEIITLRTPSANPVQETAQHITPETLKTWLDEKQDFTLLDVRNDYEIDYGTFQDAVNLHLRHFTDFPKAAEKLTDDKPIVMFCTGGIRCEKAALYLQQQGLKNVFQLQGGILNYFAKTNGEHYEGECFVFDDRISVNSNLQSDDET